MKNETKFIPGSLYRLKDQATPGFYVYFCKYNADKKQPFYSFNDQVRFTQDDIAMFLECTKGFSQLCIFLFGSTVIWATKDWTEKHFSLIK